MAHDQRLHQRERLATCTWIVWLASLLFLDYVRFYAWFGRSRLAATNCTIAVLDGLRNFRCS